MKRAVQVVALLGVVELVLVFGSVALRAASPVADAAARKDSEAVRALLAKGAGSGASTLGIPASAGVTEGAAADGAIAEGAIDGAVDGDEVEQAPATRAAIATTST